MYFPNLPQRSCK